MGTEDEGVIKEAISILKESGSIHYAEQMAKSLVSDAWHILQSDLPAVSEISIHAKS